VIRTGDCAADLRSCNADEFDGERPDRDDIQLFAASAEAMLTDSLWTEAGLVNCACGKIEAILKPQDDRKARVVMVEFPIYVALALPVAHPEIILLWSRSRRFGVAALRVCHSP
jgi:hypothetical protein